MDIFTGTNYIVHQVNSKNFEDQDPLESLEAKKSECNDTHMPVTKEMFFRSDSNIEPPPPP